MDDFNDFRFFYEVLMTFQDDELHYVLMRHLPGELGDQLKKKPIKRVLKRVVADRKSPKAIVPLDQWG